MRVFVSLDYGKTANLVSFNVIQFGWAAENLLSKTPNGGKKRAKNRGKAPKNRGKTPENGENGENANHVIFTTGYPEIDFKAGIKFDVWDPKVSFYKHVNYGRMWRF
jgi:hypothetical protein